ncbi:hypothetical protein JCM11641_001217 [Rhodosporidiobolus odoratus]
MPADSRANTLDSGNLSSRRRSRSPPRSSSRRSASPPSRDYARDSRDSRSGRYRDEGDDRRDRDRRGGGGYDRRGGGGGGHGGGGGSGRGYRDSERQRSRSPPPSHPHTHTHSRRPDRPRSRSRSRSRSPGRPSKALPPQNALVPGGGGGGRDMEYGKQGGGGEDEERKVVESKPDFGLSGALAAETNTLNGVVLKYAEPPEARKPVRNWRLYVFKGKEQVDLVHVHRQSCYLVGRDRVVADIPIDHPSTSKQHAVLQFRQVTERSEFGDSKSLTKPFILDLDSANGTLVNDEQIPASRYYELRSGDVLKFAFSTREYVLLVES